MRKFIVNFLKTLFGLVWVFLGLMLLWSLNPGNEVLVWIRNIVEAVPVVGIALTDFLRTIRAEMFWTEDFIILLIVLLSFTFLVFGLRSTKKLPDLEEVELDLVYATKAPKVKKAKAVKAPKAVKGELVLGVTRIKVK